MSIDDRLTQIEAHLPKFYQNKSSDNMSLDSSDFSNNNNNNNNANNASEKTNVEMSNRLKRIEEILLQIQIPSNSYLNSNYKAAESIIQ